LRCTSLASSLERMAPVSSAANCEKMPLRNLRGCTILSAFTLRILVSVRLCVNVPGGLFYKVYERKVCCAFPHCSSCPTYALTILGEEPCAVLNFCYFIPPPFQTPSICSLLSKQESKFRNSTKQLTPGSGFLLEKLTVTQLVAKLTAFYGTEKLISASTCIRN
jgi:hypothetical protein